MVRPWQAVLAEWIESELWWQWRKIDVAGWQAWWSPVGSLHCWTLGVRELGPGNRMVRFSNNGHGGGWARGGREGFTLDLGLTVRLRAEEADDD